ncbi:unnamed protein product [Clonostachys rhizophaga]|uniref:Uncharacterized protein n=1 Tax=Clonostachys rhizophaga TaxID=160324 RepID=A0A9N9V890_9HYPO|nr:unnamed protein product [Clonostachys rhizophaga]
MRHSFVSALLLGPLAAQAACTKSCKPKSKTCGLVTVTEWFTVTGTPGQVIPSSSSAQPTASESEGLTTTSGLIIGSSVLSSNAPTTPPTTITTPGSLPPESLTTSTIFTTSIKTVTNCGPEVTNCPGGSTVLVTETIPIATTVCPITEIPTGSASFSSSASGNSSIATSTQSTGFGSVSTTGTADATGGSSIVTGTESGATTTIPGSATTSGASLTTPGTQPPAGGDITSTIFTTSIHTVTNCGTEVTSCPADSTSLSTETIPVSTTVLSQTTPGSTGYDSSAWPIGSTTSGAQGGSTTVPPVGDVTSTLYTTEIRTVTSCGAEVTSCPATVITESRPYTTTVIPSSLVSSIVSTPVATPTSYESSANPIGSTSTGGGEQGSITGPPVGDVTSTIFTTTIRTITSCGSEVTNCPGNGTAVVTETIPVSTVVTTGTADATTPGSSAVITASSSLPPESLTTSTIFTTSIRTVTDCGSGTEGCTSGAGSTIFVTETIPISTTVCPISDLPQTPTTTAVSTPVSTPASSSSLPAQEPSASSTAATSATKTSSSPFEGATGIDIIIPEIRQCDNNDQLDLPGMPWSVTNDMYNSEKMNGTQCTNFNRVVVSNGTYLVNWTSITDIKKIDETADVMKGYSNIEASLNGTHHLTEIKSIPTFFRWNRTIGDGFKGSNVINVKTSSIENALEGDVVNEFVLYLHTWDEQRPIGWSDTPAATVEELYGTNWSVYEGTRATTNQTVRSLVPDVPVESELYIDLKTWLDAMVTKGFAKSDEYLNAASCGTEVFYGNSTQNAAVALNVNV